MPTQEGIERNRRQKKGIVYDTWLRKRQKDRKRGVKTIEWKKIGEVK